jgi:hypothetical protein
VKRLVARLSALRVSAPPVAHTHTFFLGQFDTCLVASRSRFMAATTPSSAPKIADPATSTLAPAIRLDKDSALAYVGRGNAYSKQGNINAANADYAIAKWLKAAQ